MNGVYSNNSASSSSDNMNTSYDIDSFLDFSGGISTPNLTSNASDKDGKSASFDGSNMQSFGLPQTQFPAPSFQYEAFPQQTEPFPYNGFNSTSNLSSPSMANSIAVSPATQSTMYPGMDVDSLDPSSFFMGDFQGSNINFDINDKELDLDVLAGIKQERSTSNASSMSTASSNYNPRPSSSRKSAQATQDPAVEERIKLILEGIKQKALTEDAQYEDNESPLPHLSRSRKDEEDMDEDERLLASEEGKKLTSKERRQLRNKVSARAFRSRRKEYIGQLEAECAAKNVELNESKDKLRKAEAEIKNLKELTHMLLASPQFSSFLDQLHPETAKNGLNLAAMSMPQPLHSNVSVHRATVPQVQIQAPVDNFVAPSYLPNNYMPTYNPNKDTNPNQLTGVEDWPLAYPSGSWNVGTTPIFNAALPTDIVDATELAGKSMFDALAPCDGFRPDFCASIPNEKESIQPDYSNSYDVNGQYIFDVYEDELEDVPDYLYDHFEIHAPVGEKKETPSLPKAEDILPTLGLTKLFAELEQKFPEQVDCITTSSETIDLPTQTCRPTDLNKTLEAIESTYRRIGVYCSV